MVKIEYSPEAYIDLEHIGDYIAILFPGLSLTASSEEFTGDFSNTP